MGVFVPAVLVFSALTLAGWLAVGSPAAHAFSAALAVLIIACPCALGLATPAALMVACGRGAELGIFIKGVQSTGIVARVDTVVLDKTGTVTTGSMAVVAVEWRRVCPGGHAPVRRRGGAGVRAPGGRRDRGAGVGGAAVSCRRREGFVDLPGRGALGVVDGHEVIVGREVVGRSRMTVRGAGGRPVPAWEQEGRTMVLAGWNGQLRGAIAVGDAVKPSAAAAVARLRQLGLRTVLLTGDTRRPRRRWRR